jgi:hypothetical protein
VWALSCKSQQAPLSDGGPQGSPACGCVELSLTGERDTAWRVHQSAGGKQMSGGQYPPYVFGSCIDSAVMWQGHAEAGCVSDITVEVSASTN